MDRGYFITFEGGDGSGKSTQIQILKDFLENKGFDVIVTREPGGTAISEKIRDIILDKDNDDMDDMTEALLYAAARAQLVSQVIRPALAAGKIVICDRFVDSSIAYQAFGRGLGDAVGIINSFAIAECMPDMTILLKVNPEVGTGRISGRQRDRIELASDDFHRRVYEGYLKLEEMYPERIVGVDAADTIQSIAGTISEKIIELLEK